ncbi:pirin family protein [Aquimarina sp. ERC-38]|uniref:pirin family protein n=1 Tax=Aquimarina sp. ERC-38 TaxID=2949996 RepID=UPI0022481618|nr:pirin family protein [Aquimarina sp. ERC-38]UZO81133.1 pirin family protein [Aquimarina sp. ERC-38]
MSNIGLIIEERSRDIGDFLVGRLLPFRKKRMVGPFIFIDHMGPATIKPGNYLDVGEHPHIGLSTLTYLLEGAIMHRDSTGAVQRINAGDVGWMTAGNGVVHTERTPSDLRDGSTHHLHGFQIWVALPRDKEEMAAQFSFTPGADLPTWTEGELSYKLVAGKGFGCTSSVPVFSYLFMIEIISKNQALLDINKQVSGEVGVCIVEGYIEACGERIEKGNILVSKYNDACVMTVGASTKLLLFGGEPFEEERFIFWNFVSSSKERIEQAKEKWKAKDFTMVPGEDEYIPLPT